MSWLRTILGTPGSQTTGADITFGTPPILLLHQVANAVNSAELDNASTGANLALIANGADTTVGWDIKTKGGLALRLVDVAPLVNFLKFTGTATGSDPVLSVGGDANRGLQIQPNGTGSVAIGAPSLATAAVGGFAYLPAVAGVPSGAPTGMTGYAPVVVDTTDGRVYFYSGGAWNALAPGGALPGTIQLYGSVTPPAGWLACDGSAVSRTTYAALFAVTGTSFGVGNGSTTFNVPDLRSRVPVGAGQGAGLTNRVLGTTGGEENHVLTTGELAVHQHGMSTAQISTSAGAAIGFNTAASSTLNAAATPSTDNNGSGTGHNTMQPWQAIQYIIKT